MIEFDLTAMAVETANNTTQINRERSDNEIIEALKCCRNTDNENYLCDDCPYEGTKCAQLLPSDSLRLIKRQQAEIKKLKEALEVASCCIDECRYSLTKVSNSRVESAIEDWETYCDENEWIEDVI